MDQYLHQLMEVQITMDVQGINNDGKYWNHDIVEIKQSFFPNRDIINQISNWASNGMIWEVMGMVVCPPL